MQRAQAIDRDKIFETNITGNLDPQLCRALINQWGNGKHRFEKAAKAMDRNFIGKNYKWPINPWNWVVVK